ALGGRRAGRSSQGGGRPPAAASGRGAATEVGPLPRARLLSAHRRDRQHRRVGAGDRARAGRDAVFRTARPPHRSRWRRLHGAQEAGRVLLMTARPDPTAFALETFLHQQERKSLLRFVVCGSVDHGKSTLIGRLLYEAKLLFEDQVEALTASARRAGPQQEIDFSLLLDGLAAEREQKITIDVAYRFFTTEKRKFIVADAPGHEEYTRNM